MLLGFVDTYMLSHYSDRAAAGVSTSNQIIMMVNIVFSITSGGTAVLTAQYLGAKKRKKASEVFAVSLIVNSIVGLLFSVGLYMGAGYIIGKLGLESSLFSHAKTYLMIVGSMSFAQAIFVTISATIRSHGYTKISMRTTLAMNTLNAFLDAVFIFGWFNMPVLGVKGVAMATAISRVLGMLILWGVIFSKIEHLSVLKKVKPFPWDTLKNIYKIGFPAAMEVMSYDVSQMVIIYIIVSYMSESALIAKTYVQNIVMFTYLFSAAIGQGSEIIIGHCVGERKFEEAYDLGIKSLIKAQGFTVIICFVFYLNRHGLMNLFTDDLNIIKLGSQVIAVDFVLELGRTFNVVIINSLRGAGDTLFPVVMALISMWSIGVGLAYVLGVIFNLGLTGVWIAFACDEWFRGLSMYGRWKKKKWMAKSFA
jgi:putative MATE family efflux protein